MINDSEIMPGRQRIRYDIKKKKKKYCLNRTYLGLFTDRL